MAFQFVPNADGSFTDGDKQTNPESGVEYMYHDGAWRPIGKANTNTDELDERYLQLTGGDLTGQVIMKKTWTDGREGLIIEGTLEDGTEGKMLRVYHNSNTTPDAINYKGRQSQYDNLATVGYVKDHAGGTIHVGTSAPSELNIGTMWFNTSDDTLNIKVS